MTHDLSRRTFLRAGTGLIVAAAAGACTSSPPTPDEARAAPPTSPPPGRTSPPTSPLTSLGPATSAGSTVPADAAPARATRFQPVRATRIVDTHRSVGWTRIGTDRVRVRVAGRAGVPGTATAAALSVTATASTGPVPVAVVPAGRDSAGAVAPGPATRSMCFVMLDDGAVDVLHDAVSPVVTVDVVGYFEPVGSAASGGRMVSVVPTTIVDTMSTTRPFGPAETRRVTVDAAAPADASAVVVLVSVLPTDGGWTLHPANADDIPVTLVAGAGSGSTVVALAAGGFDVTAHDGGHVSIAVVAYVTGASAAASVEGLFVPTLPTRVLDTRLLGQPIPAGSSREVALGPPSCGAFALHITSVAVDGGPEVTAWDAGGSPLQPRGRIGPGTAGTSTSHRPVIPAGRRGVAIGSWDGEAHVVADLYGWFVGDRSTTQVPVLGSQPLGIASVDMESQADEWLDYGTSSDGRPLRAFRHGSGERVGLITTGLHGDEHTGTSVLADLVTHDAIPGWTLWLIPVANPDARAANRRYVHDVDMNRDFPAGWSPLPDPTPSGCVTTRTGPIPHSLVESRRLAAAMTDGPFRGATISISHHDNYNWVAPQSGSPPALRGLADAYALATGLRLPGENGSIVPTSPRTTSVKGGFETFADSLGMSSFLVENKAGYVGDAWCAGTFGVQPDPAAVAPHHDALRSLLTDGRLPTER